MATGRRPRTARGVVGTAVTATILAVLPPCLLGALGVVVRRDLDFTAAQLGIAVGAFYAGSSVVALISGRLALAEYLGIRRSIFAGVSVVTLVMVFTAFFATDWVHIAIATGVAGLANGLTQPAANLALARRVPTGRLGLAFGVKQAAVPAATLLAGVAVSGIAVLGDWRVAFWIGASASAVFLLGALITGPRLRMPRFAAAAGRPRQRLRIDSVLLRVTIASGLASVGANAMRVFFVEAAVEAGEQLAVAGLVLAIASLAGIVTRLVGGWRSDADSRNPMRVASLLIFAGSAGYLLMAFASDTLLLVIAAVLGISAGWGWSGLVQLGTVRTHQDAPGAASAFIHFGTLFGSLVGPVLFGALSTFGFPVAWIVVAVVSAAGGALLVVSGGREP